MKWPKLLPLVTRRKVKEVDREPCALCGARFTSKVVREVMFVDELVCVSCADKHWPERKGEG